MFSPDSFHSLKKGLRNHDSKSETELWQRYVGQLTRLARRHLGQRQSAAGDSEDAVLSAMHSFFQWVGKNPDSINDSEHLSALLAMFIFRKCRQHARKQAALKSRPNEKNRSLDHDGQLLMNEVVDPQMMPLENLMVQETLDSLLEGCSPKKLQIVELHLQGLDIESISNELRCSNRTVHRTLERMRHEIQQEIAGIAS